jgi:hypothetical protein
LHAIIAELLVSGFLFHRYPLQVIGPLACQSKRPLLHPCQLDCDTADAKVGKFAFTMRASSMLTSLFDENASSVLSVLLSALLRVVGFGLHCSPFFYTV